MKQEIVSPNQVQNISLKSNSNDLSKTNIDSEEYRNHNNTYQCPSMEQGISAVLNTGNKISISLESPKLTRESFEPFLSTLKKLALPEGVTDIPEHFFEKKEKKLEPEEGRIFDLEGFSKLRMRWATDGYTLSIGAPILVSSFDKLEELVLPSTIKTLGKGAFLGLSSVKEFEIPNGVEVIHEETFKDCSKVRKITLPSTIKEIESTFRVIDCDRYDNYVSTSPFRGCYELEEVNIPEGITEIADGLFYASSGLKTLEIPSSVKRIGRYAFANSGIEKLIVPKNVDVIDENAFRWCKNLKEIYIPKETELASNCFRDCEEDLMVFRY